MYKNGNQFVRFPDQRGDIISVAQLSKNVYEVYNTAWGERYSKNVANGRYKDVRDNKYL